MSEQFKLVIMKDGQADREVDLQDGENLIGRWDPDTGSFPEVDLEEEDTDAKVSRKHAVIIKSGRQLTVEDLGSLNGTFINRTEQLKPGHPRPLSAGDEIMVGGVFMKIVKE